MYHYWKWGSNLQSPLHQTLIDFKYLCDSQLIYFKINGITAGGGGHQENQPTDQEKRKTRGSEKEKKEGKKERKEKKKKGGKRNEGKEGKGKESRGKERNLVFTKYQVNTIDQNYNNASLQMGQI